MPYLKLIANIERIDERRACYLLTCSLLIYQKLVLIVG